MITLRQTTVFPENEQTAHDSAASDHLAESAGSIYDSLARHQREEEWGQRDRFCCFQEWAERFDFEFELQIPELTLRVGVLPVSRLGHFRYGHNDMGLRGEVAINARYVSRLPLWEVLGVLLHEQLHAWQQAHGTPGKRNYHNAEYREKAESLGLIVDERGFMGYAAESRFKDLLRRHGIDVSEAPSPPQERRAKGQSKMKKWACACGVNVRCAVVLHARCLDCGHDFRRAD